ncbi:PhoH family protein [Undibacterium sp. RTI2.1]|uniref:PhoH family protein n=1 Tax=unclassified Undibacterium TaxID=2630295 RepID=UPI002AB4EFAD|nr:MULTISPECIES: PhoH family protein [unclassified Undibacterium]MDY7537632.1 PhoH family protein [Undibacterium sp. 5I1]MEB0029233.1 PhoH family protein [Undibacterium sp. RTI2.1]MEB0115541.1 PhoH family protein [Undibacterium sp. RTI2.2]MEB0230177.1 PhoH family protein [Undibacterium sp. 10I3]MEB0256369.1 PhoH family protein [Undibacterium sp. 5I1]
MSRNFAKKQSKRSSNKQEFQDQSIDQRFHKIPDKIDRSPITALKPKQQQYINAIKNFDVTFATGPAGTGKTYLCAALAAQELDAKRIDKIIITRPAVEAGESLGFLPGELEEKFDPYLTPFREILDLRLGKTFVDYLIKNKRIEAAPLAFMRGRTFTNAWVILDEAQNTTPMQMKMFLTRIGKGCKMIINGDVDQKDIPGKSGLADAIGRFNHIPAIKHVKFDREDSVRHDLVQDILLGYETEPV